MYISIEKTDGLEYVVEQEGITLETQGKDIVVFVEDEPDEKVNVILYGEGDLDKMELDKLYIPIRDIKRIYCHNNND